MKKPTQSDDPLAVRSVEKTFRILSAFDEQHPSLSLIQLATAIDMDKSSTQRFTHTLVQLGYLSKDPKSKQFRLTVKLLDLGYHYLMANPLVDKARPYLLHLSKETEETINLTILDGTEIVYLSRFLSRHVLNHDVTVGTRRPAFCTAPGIAMLAGLPQDTTREILERSDLKAYTAHTVFRMEDLLAKIEVTARRGYATAFEEYYYGDLSIAAPVIDAAGVPVAAINIAVSRARYTPNEAEERFSSLVVAAALAVSQTGKRLG